MVSNLCTVVVWDNAVMTTQHVNTVMTTHITSGHLRKHIRVHSGEKPTPNELKTHNRIHSGQKSYIWQAQDSNSIHSGEKPYA